MYPEGDKSVPPSGRMPKGGFYFDSVPRQLPVDDDNLKLEDNLEEFTPICGLKIWRSWGARRKGFGPKPTKPYWRTSEARRSVTLRWSPAPG